MRVTGRGIAMDTPIEAEDRIAAIGTANQRVFESFRGMHTSNVASLNDTMSAQTMEVDEEGPSVSVTITYAIGDIHGCLRQMLEATEWAAADAESKGANGLVIFLGDYVDRGGDAPGVIETLMNGPKDSHMRWLPLKGNHDDMIAKIWQDPEHVLAGQWWEHGGQHTLMNYGWDPLLDPVPRHLGEWIPERHAAFLGSLPLHYEDDDRIYVHAGLRPGVPLAGQSEKDMLWIRKDFLNSEWDFGKTVVHGHTPHRRNPDVKEGRVNLDTGCYATGVLACGAFDPGAREPRIWLSGNRPCESMDVSPKLR